MHESRCCQMPVRMLDVNAHANVCAWLRSGWPNYPSVLARPSFIAVLCRIIPGFRRVLVRSSVGLGVCVCVCTRYWGPSLCCQH